MTTGSRTVLDAIEGDAIKFDQHTQIQRFIERSLTELWSLSGDALTITLTKAGAEVSYVRGGSVLKNTELSREWFKPLSSWLLQRGWVFASGTEGLPHIDDGASGRFAGKVAVRVGEELAVCQVQRLSQLSGKHTITLSQFNVMPFSQAQALLGPFDYLQEPAEKLLALKNGVILLSSPHTNQLQAALGAMTVLLQAHVVGPLEKKNLELAISLSSERTPCIVYSSGDDALQTLLKVSTMGVRTWPEFIGASLTLGFVRRTCEFCAREAKPDHSALKQLPEGLMPEENFRYVVGRGCEQCNATGTQGMQAIMSMLVIDDFTRQLLERTLDESALLTDLYARGLKPLLEDGVRKVVRGRVTLEGIFSLARTVPPAYERVLKLAGPYAVRGASAVPRQGTQVKGLLSESGPLHSDSGPVIPRINREKPLVLVVEDDPDQRAILEMVFKAANYDLMLANNGIEALALLKNKIPDIVISDLMMPQMDGREFITRLKLEPHLRTIPVLVLTVINDSEKEYDLLDVGADDYCEKTIQRKVLLKRVENLLKRRG